MMSIFVIIIGCYIVIDWIIDIVIFINILLSFFNIVYFINISIEQNPLKSKQMVIFVLDILIDFL